MDHQPAGHEDRIREMAHRIWENEGRPQGQEKRHWDMAETLIRAGRDDWTKSEASAGSSAIADLSAGIKHEPKVDARQSAAAPEPRARSRTGVRRRKSNQTSHRE